MNITSKRRVFEQDPMKHEMLGEECTSIREGSQAVSEVESLWIMLGLFEQAFEKLNIRVKDLETKVFRMEET